MPINTNLPILLLSVTVTATTDDGQIIEQVWPQTHRLEVGDTVDWRFTHTGVVDREDINHPRVNPVDTDRHGT